ncbi:hypothetical protein QTP88_025205 [Uroleucon formosanum]
MRFWARSGDSSEGHICHRNGFRKDPGPVTGRGRVSSINHLGKNDGSGSHQRDQHQRKQGVVKGNARSVHFTKPEGSPIQTTPMRTSRRGQTNGKEKCQVCGRTNHDTGLYRFKNYSCNTCGVAGHLALMCKNKNNKHKSQSKFLTENERSGDHESSVELIDSFFTINDISRNKLKVAPYRVKLVIGGKPISFEIDTGSVHSIISKSTFKALIGPKVIVTNDVELSDYVGNRITPIGKVALMAMYNNKTFGIWVYIVPNGGPPILSRNDIATIGIKNMFECKFTGAEDSVKTILKKYPNVFSEELGTFKGYKISFTTVLGITPTFFKHRPVPLALRIKVEAEIDRLLAIDALIPDDAEHNIRLKQLLKALGLAGLRVKERKCTFMQTEVEYLGHKIDGKGLHTLDKHTIAIKEFVENAARILKPLYDLLKMGTKWSWFKEADEAFNSIKSILSSKPVLDHYDPSVPIKLMVDASSFAIGAVISQVYGNAEKPVAYTSRVLSEAERKYPQIEKEGLAIIYGVQKF